MGNLELIKPNCVQMGIKKNSVFGELCQEVKSDEVQEEQNFSWYGLAA